MSAWDLSSSLSINHYVQTRYSKRTRNSLSSPNDDDDADDDAADDDAADEDDDEDDDDAHEIFQRMPWFERQVQNIPFSTFSTSTLRIEWMAHHKHHSNILDWKSIGPSGSDFQMEAFCLSYPFGARIVWPTAVGKESDCSSIHL